MVDDFTSLRDRIAVVLTEAYPGKYADQAAPEAEAVIAALGIYEDEMGTGAAVRTRIMSDWEKP